MRKFKIHPNVISVGQLHDKTKEYPESTWERGRADELLDRGFLIEVPEPKPEVKKKK